MAPIPQSGNSGFTLGGFLILAALGTFIWKGAPLDSVRPSSEQSGWYEHKFAQKVPARLWQDPFKAVHAHEQAIKSGTADISYETTPLSQTLTDLQTNSSDVDVTLLMVLVSPGSYAVQEERRRRHRYAVLSGLGEEHFVPRNPEMLNVLYQRNANASTTDCFLADKTPASKTSATDEDVTGNTPSKDCYSVPYEWYDYENPDDKSAEKKQVLVLWLDESQFVESPLTGIKTFLSSLLPKSNSLANKVSATLIGPARSDTLRNLVNMPDTPAETVTHEWLRCNSGLSEFNIISSTATVDDRDLIRQKVKEIALHDISPLTKLQNKITATAGCDGKTDKQTGINFLRTIQSDDALIKKLAAELKQNRLISNEEDYVVVISEWDTYFGRSLPRAFEKHFCEPDCGENLVRYHYQRGMDGVIAGEHKPAARPKSNNQSKANGLSPAIDITTMRRPVGPAQFDYLRRLAVDIRKKDYEWRLATGHGVRAVVLLGSDVYDKLLIMRALRPELPGALFATTDLDAQLLHPAEYSWTRNMIVASTYDLSLSPQISMSTMPFRDSYQTSVYLATRLAFNKKMQKEIGLKQQNIYDKIPPQLMEIGRQALVQLPDGKDNTDTWNFVLVKSFAPSVSLGLTTIALLAIFAFHQLRPMAGRVIFVLGGLLVLFSALSVLISIKNTGGEPMAFLAGASIWPAEYIRLFSVVLSLVYIWSVINILHKSWRELEVRYFIRGTETIDDGVTVMQIWQALIAKLGHPVRWLRQLTCKKIFSVLMIAIMILIMKFILPIKWPLDEKIWLLITVWGVLIVFWWLLIYGHITENFKVLSVNKWDASCVSDNKDAVDMWRTYGDYGAGEQRFLRTIAYILLYFAFASILFALLGPPTSPCRGTFACNMDKMILGFSVLSMLVLLFLVVDAARLCICWVDSMHKHDLDWSNTRKSEFVQKLRLPDAHAVAWMKVHLIGERTRDVTRLIYFPVMIILLLLLARSTYFDNWDFPQALAIVIGLNFVIALGSVVRLNFVAQSTREDILRKLQDEQLAADRVEDVIYEPSSSERTALIHELESLRIGAYLRVWDQPPVRATLMLLGGVALTFAEYLTVFLH